MSQYDVNGHMSQYDMKGHLSQYDVKGHLSQCDMKGGMSLYVKSTLKEKTFTFRGLLSSPVI